ncbi:hypothetical protein MYU51_000017 [Penicillium brevicompactum]
MDSPESVTRFLKSLEDLILLFEDQDPNPLSGRQERQLLAWNALLKEDGPVKRSRTRTHVRMHARKIAFKVKKTAGSETVLLYMLRYSISIVPKADQTINHRASNDRLIAEQQNSARFHYESAYSGGSATTYNRTESQMGGQRGIEVAFDVPSNILDTFVELHKRSEHSQGHSAILTIPTQQDRVASLVLSISRSEAVANGGKHDLTEIFNAGFPSSSAEHDLPEMFNSGSPSA